MIPHNLLALGLTKENGKKKVCNYVIYVTRYIKELATLLPWHSMEKHESLKFVHGK